MKTHMQGVICAEDSGVTIVRGAARGRNDGSKVVGGEPSAPRGEWRVQGTLPAWESGAMPPEKFFEFQMHVSEFLRIF
jgi:hypothetical protein